MIRLIYTLERSSLTAKRPTLYLTDVSGSADGDLHIVLKNVKRGRLTVGERTVDVSEIGNVFSSSDIPDGIVMPRLVLGTETVTATPFEKRGKDIHRAPLDEGDYAELREMIIELEKRLEKQIVDLYFLEERIKGRSMFKFKDEERNQNEKD